MKGEMDTVDDEEENKRKGIPQGSSPDKYSPRMTFCIRTIIDLFLDHHRQSKILFFMHVFLLHWKFKKCKVFTLLLRFSQFTKRTGTRYISMVFFE